MIEDSKRETVVFAYDTEEQRQAILAMFPDWHSREAGPRIVGLSHDNEMKRVSLIQDAMDRYSDHYDQRDAIEAIMQHPNLSRFKWSDVDETEA